MSQTINHKNVSEREGAIVHDISWVDLANVCGYVRAFGDPDFELRSIATSVKYL